MAILSGVDGSCLMNTASFPVTSWTYSGTITTEEVTQVGDTDKEYKQTTKDGSGSITANFDTADASQKIVIDFLLTGQTPAEVLLQLYQDSTNTDQLYFSAVITSIDLPKAPNAVDIATINFQKTGVLYLVPTT